jgi:hypothetical protein
VNADEHLAKARFYAGLVDGLWFATGGMDAEQEAEAIRQMGDLANAGRLHLDLHRELILREALTPGDWRPARLADLIDFPDKTAPARPAEPAGAADTNPHQED